MRQYKNLLINIISIVYLIVLFVVTCLVFSHFLSQGNVDLTAEMTDASLPVVHISMGDEDINYLYGYTETMDCAYMRDALTVIGADRKVDYVIDTYGTDIDTIKFEVRSIDGSRLVEDDTLSVYSRNGDQINGSLTIKDLITKGDEYMLIFIINMKDGREVRYYTRLLWSEDMHVDEKTAFIYDFSSETFKGENASDISKYLESNSSGDNSTYEHVDIHSSFKQVTWGDLSVRQIGTPRLTVNEITEATGYFRLEYQAGIREESGEAVCNVVEYYRLRYTADRIYLLNWERYCDQIPEETGDIYTDDQIELGITAGDIEINECDGGTIFAFVDEGKLISVNPEENKTALLYSFYGNNDDLNDIRNLNQDRDLHILNVDETGNVIFMVYGYMNRGDHEGRVGISVYEYNSAMNTIEETAYVDYTGSASILMNNIAELSYSDRDGKVYFMLERNVYEIDTDSGVLSVVASSLQDEAYKVSASGRLLAWQGDGDDLYSCTKLRLMNLGSGISEDVKAGYGENIIPLGFMNDDLVYGLAKTRDIKQDIDGTIIFPMYKVIIRNSEGDILKDYGEDGIYVMDCEFTDGLMNMTRASYDEATDSYIAVDNDQIVSTEEKTGLDNQAVQVVTESLETVVQISMKNSMADANRICLTPKEIIYEGSRELYRPDTDVSGHYYVYGLHGYADTYLQVGNAVNEAYNQSGIVVNSLGQSIWCKTTRSGKNQIMAITEPTQTEAGESLAACVDAMLRYEGITTNSRILLSQGETVLDILEEYMDDGIVLNLTGCNLDAVLYYVSRDIPVLAIMNDQTAYLITGYNDNEIVLYDPQTGELHKENTTDMDTIFKSNGYKFITYAR